MRALTIFLSFAVLFLYWTLIRVLTGSDTAALAALISLLGAFFIGRNSWPDLD